MKIVAPAGSIERFYAAIKAGADEIYMGLKGYGARRNAVNLTLDEYREALDYAHLRGVKVFLTLNTIMYDREIENVYKYLKELYAKGLDAVIVQDLGLAKFIRENFKDIEIHGSTQMTVANHVEINYLESIGFSRVVLPRELSYEEIKSIKEKTKIELEVFVSGALCISYSGNCYMSSFIGRRSGNRGMCAQPCRKKYSCDGKNVGYILSPKDQLYGYEEINKLKDIGIHSIKIEGRMKDVNYVFQTVNYYKKLIESDKNNSIEEKSSTLFNRGYELGYFYKNEKNKLNENILNSLYSGNIGKNIGKLNGKELKLEEKIILGDGIIYLNSKYENIGGTYINKIDTKHEKNKKIAEKNEIILLKDIPKGTRYIHRNYSKEINDETESIMKKISRRQKVYFEIKGKVGESLKLKISTLNNRMKNIVVDVESEEKIENAVKNISTKELLSEKLLELGESTFLGEIKEIEIDENIFIPVSIIKKLKRAGIEKLSEKLLNSYERKINEEIIILPKQNVKKVKSQMSAIVRNEEQKKCLKKFGITKIYFNGVDVATESNLHKIDLENKLATNLYQAIMNKNNKITLGWNFNISNRYAFEHFSTINQVDIIIISPEISYTKIKEFGGTKVKKGLIVYSKIKGMYTELDFNIENEKIIENEQGDKFKIIKNKFGNGEIYLQHPLNVMKDIKLLDELGISEYILEFTDETIEEIEEILQEKGKYKPYNYEEGVY